MKELRVENAIITGTMLGREDHGIMTASISLKTESYSSGFGGYGLDSYSESQKERIGHRFGIEFVMRVLDVVGVDTWERLTGKHCRVETEDGWGGRIRRIGNILENKWFDPAELAERIRREDGE